MTEKNSMIQISWEIKPFNKLGMDVMYDILKLRVDVFVVEQRCPYNEIDGKDRHSKVLHLFGKNEDGELAAYLRILPPGLSYNEVSIGRVVVAKNSRGHGICDAMVEKAFEHISSEFPKKNIKIGAQVYLKGFYQSHGFETASDEYLEDGIPHIDMLRKCS